MTAIKLLRKKLCLLLIWILGSFSHWFLFKWNVIKTGYFAYDSAVPWMEFLILFPMGLIQITCSRIVDFCPISYVLSIVVSLALLPMLFNLDSIHFLVGQQILHGCGLALVVPSCAKYFSIVFNEGNLNLVFCLLRLALNSVRILTRICDAIDFDLLDYSKKTWIILMILNIIISICPLMIMNNREGQQITPRVLFNKKLYYKSRIINTMSFAALTLKFAEEIIIQNYVKKRFVSHDRIPQASAELVINLSGYISAVLMNAYGGNTFTHYCYELHGFCYALLSISFTLVHLELLDIRYTFIILGVYLGTPDIFLTGSLPLIYGERRDHSGATVFGIVNGFGILGQASAIFVMYFVPISMYYVVITASIFLYTYSIYKLKHCNQFNLRLYNHCNNSNI